jgi:hypothetical protein
MPQATKELRDQWEDDSVALAQLGTNFTIRAGVIRACAGHEPSPDDFSAIDYLCQEWDYGYERAQ